MTVAKWPNALDSLSLGKGRSSDCGLIDFTRSEGDWIWMVKALLRLLMKYSTFFQLLLITNKVRNLLRANRFLCVAQLECGSNVSVLSTSIS